MKVTLYNHTGKVSGAERVLLTSVKALSPLGINFTLVCPEDGPLRSSVSALHVGSVVVPALNARFTSNPFRFFVYLASVIQTLFSLRRALKSTEPDLVHANSIRAGIVGTLATIGTGLPILWHIHDILPRHPISTLIRLLAFSSKRTYLVSCCLAAARRFANPPFANNKLTVVHNGIDVSGFSPDWRVREESRSNLSVTPDDVVIGIVGQITARKGQLGLIRAFAKLHAQASKAKLLIVGAPMFNKDQEYLRLLEHEVQKLSLEDHVRFLGHHPDVRAVMQALDVVVLNSTVEPFSLVLLEAMAMGKAVIATDSGGAVEVVDDGSNGVIIPVGNQERLLEALASVVLSPLLRKQYGQSARSVIASSFTQQHYIESLREVYVQVLGSEPVAKKAALAEPHGNI